MRFKVCGLTLIRDLRLAERAGAEYVGFVVEADSPRAVTKWRAAMLARAARAKPVYVTVDMPINDLVELVQFQQPAAVQLHGDESAETIKALVSQMGDKVAVWKALSMPADLDQARAELDSLVQKAQQYKEAGAQAILLDTRLGGRSGGTGVSLPLCVAREFVQQCPLPCILAGGIGPDNVLEVWQQVEPWAVDMSSRLERSPGVKDPAAMKRLAEVLAAHRAER